jgi:shikimate dehydrogenase
MAGRRRLTADTSGPDRYLVVGHPVAHSQSPWIHARFAARTGQAMVYAAMDVPPGTFQASLTRFFSGGGRGCNVTLPWKLHAYRLADRHTERARRAGAVNTLAIAPDGQLTGDNTDGAGLVRDLEARGGVPLAGSKILLLGAGGAARGCLAPLLAAGARGITVANRTRSKALALAARFGEKIAGVGLDEVRGEPDIIINATAASLQGSVPPLPRPCLARHPLCYDMMYGADDTPFVAWARRAGCPALDGLGMLVEQAAESFLLWRGVRPETGEVLADLRNRLRHPWPGNGP